MSIYDTCQEASCGAPIMPTASAWLKSRGMACPYDGEHPRKGGDARVQSKPLAPAGGSGGKQGTGLEARFLQAWGQYAPDMPQPAREYVFCADRGWRFDFCWPDASIAVEMEGFDHKRTDRYFRDLEKYNYAAAVGFCLFRCTAGMLRDDAAGFVALVAHALMERERL